jgi:hypothetical protein
MAGASRSQRRDLDGDDAHQDQRAAGDAAGVEAITHEQEAEQGGEDGFGGEDDRRVGGLCIALPDHLRGEADAHRHQAGVGNRQRCLANPLRVIVSLSPAQAG